MENWFAVDRDSSTSVCGIRLQWPKPTMLCVLVVLGFGTKAIVLTSHALRRANYSPKDVSANASLTSNGVSFQKFVCRHCDERGCALIDRPACLQRHQRHEIYRNSMIVDATPRTAERRRQWYKTSGWPTTLGSAIIGA